MFSWKELELYPTALQECAHIVNIFTHVPPEGILSGEAVDFLELYLREEAGQANGVRIMTSDSHPKYHGVLCLLRFLSCDVLYKHLPASRSGLPVIRNQPSDDIRTKIRLP